MFRGASAVTGLLSDTKYEYQLMDGDVLSTVVCTFTTEKALQLENSSFEYWSGSMPAYIATSSAESDIFGIQEIMVPNLRVSILRLLMLLLNIVEHILLS